MKERDEGSIFYMRGMFDTGVLVVVGLDLWHISASGSGWDSFFFFFSLFFCFSLQRDGLVVVLDMEVYVYMCMDLYIIRWSWMMGGWMNVCGLMGSSIERGPCTLSV
jgi:hypothetical protein